jgi:hypothetical protein
MKYALPLGILLLLCLPMPMLVQATHGHWIDHYRSVNGASCCGMRDCVRVAARLVEDRGTAWRAEVNGTSVILHKKSVHLSEEPVAY